MSEGNGPWQSMPRARRARTAGAMTSISSRPKRPFSPPCGFSAHTAMRGAREARAAHGARRRARAPRSMRCGVIWSSAVRSATCEVTRDIHRSSSTFISPKKPWCCVRCANSWCSSLNFQPPACSAALLSGAKQMPSTLPSRARSMACSSVSPVSRPDSAETCPRGMRAGSMFAEVDDRDLRRGSRRHRAPPVPARARRPRRAARAASASRAIGEHARALLRADARAVAQHQCDARSHAGLPSARRAPALPGAQQHRREHAQHA